MIDYSKFKGYTQGPWVVIGKTVWDNESQPLLDCHTGRKADAANARLAAAAPELLAENKRLREALELALKTLQDIQGKYYGDPIPDSVFEAVTSALK